MDLELAWLRSQLAPNLAWLDVPIPGDLWADLKADGLVRADAPTPS